MRGAGFTAEAVASGFGRRCRACWPADLSTISPVAAFSRTAVMPAAALLTVLNSGDTATTVPSGAVSLKKYFFPLASAISKMPAKVAPPQKYAPLHGRRIVRSVTGLYEGSRVPECPTTLPAGTLRQGDPGGLFGVVVRVHDRDAHREFHRVSGRTAVPWRRSQPLRWPGCSRPPRSRGSGPSPRRAGRRPAPRRGHRPRAWRGAAVAVLPASRPPSPPRSPARRSCG